MGLSRSAPRILAVLCAWAGLAAFAPQAPAQGTAAKTDVRALLRHVDELWRGESSQARMTMIVKTERYERTMTLDAWSRGKDDSLVVIRAPKKDQGVATLKAGRNIWNYLPKIDRVTKIPPSMMMGSWMGSHFTNDDLVKESSFEEDYDPEMTFEGERGGRTVYEITLIPKPEAPVVWGKLVMVIEQDTLLPILATYYDEDLAKARTMAFGEPKRFGTRLVPSRLTLQPEDKPAESTVVLYERMEFDLKLPPDQFSLQRLQSSR